VSGKGLRPRQHVYEFNQKKCPKTNRYAFWGDTVAAELGRRLRAVPVQAERFVVNVASDEYWAVVAKHLGALGEDVPVKWPPLQL
jgi:cytoplasmic iron level regulating protein YaaA (DUF328/UPF0246 family)